MSRSSRGSPGFREVRSRRSARPLPDRGARLPKFVGLTVPAGETLGDARAMVIGGGSVGGQIVEHLVRLGIQEIRIVDRGQFKAESLLTHASVGPEAIGRTKAAWWGRRCKKISPATRVLAFAGPVEALPVEAFEGIDVVALATDNLAAEIEAGQRCVRHAVPLVQGSVFGEMLVAQVRYWSNRDGSGACPCCALGADEWQHVSASTLFRCGGKNGQPEAEVSVAPTVSVSALCSMAANMVVMHVLRHVLRLGPPLEDSLTEFCGYTGRTAVSRLTRNALCSGEHVAWDKVAIDGAVASRSLRELSCAALRREDLAADAAFTVGDDLVFAETVVCYCGWPQEVHRFCAPGQPAAKCPRCGRSLFPQPFYSYRAVPAAAIGSLLDRPLRRFGAAAARSVVVHSDGRAVLCRKEVSRP
jgi:molybdopterin/thiamine biosynthesis adenylyltransferase